MRWMTSLVVAFSIWGCEANAEKSAPLDRVTSWTEAAKAAWGSDVEKAQAYLALPQFQNIDWDYRWVRISTGWVNRIHVTLLDTQKKAGVTECYRFTIDIADDQNWRTIQTEFCVLPSKEHPLGWANLEKLHRALKPEHFFSMSPTFWIWDKRDPALEPKKTKCLVIPSDDSNPEAWQTWKAGNIARFLHSMESQFQLQRAQK